MFQPATEEMKKKQTAIMEERNRHFMALTHQVFKNDSKGAEWLEMVTESFLLLEPVASPSQDEKWAYFREGMNTFVRNIRQVIKNNEMMAREEGAK
jgi:hypothetical protein